MRQRIFASMAVLTAIVLPALPAIAQTSQTPQKEKLPVYKEGQVIATDELRVPDTPAAEIPKGKADTSRQLQLPDIANLAQGGNDTAAWRAWGEQDFVKARLLASRAGAQDDASAQLLMGLMLEKGQGGDPDPVNAVSWYKKSAQNGEKKAWLALASMAFDNRGGLSASDGRGFLHQAALAGSTPAMLSLGRAYASGMGGPIDDAQAQRWYSDAIAAGSNMARVDLADLKLASGDEPGALKLYKTAVLGGSAHAAWKAGILLADPTSKIHDFAQAGHYLQTAAEAGLPEAMTDYGTWFAHNNPPLEASAARWFRKAAQADDAAGQYQYAIALAKGDGVMQDREQAYEWALRAHAHDPENRKYEDLELALEQGLPIPVRDMIFARSKMPLMVQHTSVADANRAYAAEQKQVQAEKVEAEKMLAEARKKQAEEKARAQKEMAKQKDGTVVTATESAPEEKERQ